MFTCLIRCLLISIVGIILSSCNARKPTETVSHSHIIYVDSHNNGLEDGTQSAPYNTIQRAIDSGSFGDIIYVADGTYNEIVTVDSNSAGIALLGGFDAITWNRDIQKNQTIIDGGGASSLFCVRLIRTSNITISGFWLTNAQRIIMVYPASDVLIERNYIHDSAGDNYTSGINVESVSDFVTENVIIRNNAIWNIIGSGWRGGGIDVTIHQSSHATDNIQILNNTIYNVSQDGIDSRTIINNAVVKNNIVVKVRDTGIQLPYISVAISDYNCICDAGELHHGFLGGPNDLNVDPLFVDVTSNNFHLQSISPCIDAGDPTFDYSNEPQPNGGRINIGAYGNTRHAAIFEPRYD